MRPGKAPAAAGHPPDADQAPRLPGRLLALARLGWLAVTLLTVGLFVASALAYYDLLRTPCAGDGCYMRQLTPAGVEAYRHYGLSPGFYAAYDTALAAVFAAVWWALAAMLAWRMSANRMALVAGLVFVLYGSSQSGVLTALGATGSA